ncbi:MAG: hypothetical protein NVV66_18495 [Cellulomonas sp.]|uniref:hypothetical protein n=1 Tax=Cellulomonas sp. TaxID=40001 RepID=UPI002588A393|nr:hypothetical protein [Cellulomonas sp.]MCR6706588.1 hypothetical protein [Cellulomonas sp.]
MIPKMTPAEASAYVQDALPRLRSVIAAADVDADLEPAVRTARALADLITDTQVQRPTDAALVGHALILATGALNSVVETAHYALGFPPQSGALAANVVALAGCLLIEVAASADAAAAQDGAPCV